MKDVGRQAVWNERDMLMAVPGKERRRRVADLNALQVIAGSRITRVHTKPQLSFSLSLSLSLAQTYTHTRVEPTMTYSDAFLDKKRVERAAGVRLSTVLKS